MMDGAASSAAGVRKPPREETALGGRKAVPQALWRFESRWRDLGLGLSRLSKLADGEAW